MKVLFTDIDGVLTNAWSFAHGPPLTRAIFDPRCVVELNRITDTTGAKIVISSDWRRFLSDRELVAKFAKEGVTAKIIGSTPFLPCTIRGREIDAWLKTHRHGRFAILDDDRDMGDLAPFLVRTVFEIGLTAINADRAITILQPRKIYPRRKQP